MLSLDGTLCVTKMCFYVEKKIANICIGDISPLLRHSKFCHFRLALPHYFRYLYTLDHSDVVPTHNLARECKKLRSTQNLGQYPLNIEYECDKSTWY
jgi:hypothetical protein